MFGIGGSEFLIIAILAVMLFGPDKIPKLARTVGRFMSEFKKYQAMMESAVRAEMYLQDGPADPFKKAGEYQDTLKAKRDAEAAAAAAEAETEAEPGDAEEPVVSPEVPVSTEVDGILYDEEGDAIPDPSQPAWVPGAPGAPGMEPADESREEGEERP